MTPHTARGSGRGGDCEQRRRLRTAPARRTPAGSGQETSRLTVENRGNNGGGCVDACDERRRSLRTIRLDFGHPREAGSVQPTLNLDALGAEPGQQRRVSIGIERAIERRVFIAADHTAAPIETAPLALRCGQYGRALHRLSRLAAGQTLEPFSRIRDEKRTVLVWWWRDVALSALLRSALPAVLVRSLRVVV